MSDTKHGTYPPPRQNPLKLLDDYGIVFEGGELKTWGLHDRQEILQLAVLQVLLDISAKLDRLDPHDPEAWARTVAEEISGDER